MTSPHEFARHDVAYRISATAAASPGNCCRSSGRVIPTLAAYRPGRAAKRIALPILFCVSNTDSVTPPAETLRYARTAPRGEIKTYDAGHFDFYLGVAFEALVRDQIEFLTRHLALNPATDDEANRLAEIAF